MPFADFVDVINYYENPEEYLRIRVSDEEIETQKQIFSKGLDALRDDKG